MPPQNNLSEILEPTTPMQTTLIFKRQMRYYIYPFAVFTLAIHFSTIRRKLA